MIKKFTTKPKFIKVKNTNKIIIEIVFFLDYDLKNIVKDELISRILTTSNKKHQTYQDFNNYKNDQLIIEYDMRIRHTINKTLFIFKLVIPNENLLEGYSMKACFEYFYDNIFNANVEKDEFCLKNFNTEKDFLYRKEASFPKSIYDVIDEIGIKAINEIEKLYLTHEEVLESIKLISSKELYDYYNKNIKENSYITYIYGNLDYKDKILSLYNEYFKQKTRNFVIDINYFQRLKSTDYNLKEFHINYQQTVLKLVYQVDSFKEDDESILDTLYYFLNCRENDLLFDCLRNRHHIIYSLNISEKSKYGLIDIVVYLDKTNIEDVKKLIFETINGIKIESNFELYKNRLLMALKYDIYSNSDNIYNAVNEKILKDIYFYNTLKEKYKLIANIDSKTMTDFLDRFRLIREIVMIGDRND